MNNNRMSEPIRIADVIGGHIHPAVCITKNGRLLVVYNKEGGGGKELLLSRSNDGGVTWSDSAPWLSVPNSPSFWPTGLTNNE